MATDVLTLGGIVFDDWSTPGDLPFGGKHAMAVHKLPGGARVVDTLGPDDMDIAFTGTLFGDSAYSDGLALDGLRKSGASVALTFGGQFYIVVVEDVKIVLKRFPQYATYSVTCLIVQNAMGGALGAIVSTVGGLVGADIATALSIVGL